MHTGRKGRYTARISLLMKRSDLGRVRFEAVLRSVHRFVRLVLAGYLATWTDTLQLWALHPAVSRRKPALAARRRALCFG